MAPALSKVRALAPSTTPHLEDGRWRLSGAQTLSKYQNPPCRCPPGPTRPRYLGGIFPLKPPPDDVQPHCQFSPLCSEGTPGWPCLGHLSLSLKWRCPPAPWLDQFWGALPMHTLPRPCLSRQMTPKPRAQACSVGTAPPGQPQPGGLELTLPGGRLPRGGRGRGSPGPLRMVSFTQHPARGGAGRGTFPVRPALRVPIRWPEQSGSLAAPSAGPPHQEGAKSPFDLPSPSLSAIPRKCQQLGSA